nr:integrase core domain-containing protein [Leekyejoonella antrihumi]
MTTFCLEHGISRKTLYSLLARAREEGPAAVLEPRSRRPNTSPTRIPEEVKAQAIGVRAALESSGLDQGPISVFEKMKAMGLQPPSVPSLARIFREAGVARLEPRKRPRAAWRRFVYPAPNACWQLDATEYVLTRGRKCVIFQLQDDHSRYAVASHVADGETSEGALAVVTQGIAAHGVPQRLLTDNGLALNPTRRGFTGQLVTYVTSLGVEAITGKPYKPTTQGKNERFHQTLFRWLDKQPLAASITELQELVDQFDVIYNTQRPHQGLPGRITPRQSWDATPKAEPPRPPLPVDESALPARRSRRTPTGEATRTVYRNGQVQIEGVRYQLGQQYVDQPAHIIWDDHRIWFFDQHGTEIITHERPGLRTGFVGNGKPRGFLADQDTTPESTTGEASPMS